MRIAERARIGENMKRGARMTRDRPMPPFIAFAGVLGGLAVVRWAYKTALRINQELEEVRLERVAEASRASEIKTLRRDPVTGAYRPG
jgi:hypothetical protein